MGLARLYYDVELPLADVLGEIERRRDARGRARRSRRSARTSRGGSSDLEARIYEEVGHEFNIGSPKQLGEVLFEEMSTPADPQDQDRLLDRRQGAASSCAFRATP